MTLPKTQGQSAPSRRGRGSLPWATAGALAGYCSRERRTKRGGMSGGRRNEVVVVDPPSWTCEGVTATAVWRPSVRDSRSCSDQDFASCGQAQTSVEHIVPYLLRFLTRSQQTSAPFHAPACHVWCSELAVDGRTFEKLLSATRAYIVSRGGPAGCIRTRTGRRGCVSTPPRCSRRVGEHVARLGY